MLTKITKLFLAAILFTLLAYTAFAAVRTFYVQETDFVSIKPEAVDPDNDKVTYAYSEPFDERGEWQTGHEDSGEYEVEITASDGISESKQKILVIVENKNQPPQLTEKKIVIKETQTISLREIVEDPEGDPLSFTFNHPFNEKGEWKTGYQDEGFHFSTFTVSDGEFNIQMRLEIEILHTNQPPVIISSFPNGSAAIAITIEENEKLAYHAEAVDDDGDEISFSWKLDNELISEENFGEHYFDFESSGQHTLKLAVSDSNLETEREWKIDVEDVNRQPEVSLLPITVYEGEKVTLDLPEVDADKDILKYSFERPFSEIGEWQTGFNDAGEHEFTFTVSDGEFIEDFDVQIIVLNVDLAPILHLPEKLEVNEGEELYWNINAEDPDRDDITMTIKGTPVGAAFENGTLKWTPSYDFIRRRGGFFSDVLNAARIENFFLKKKQLPLTITACAKELCSSGEAKIIIHNVNRPPEFERVPKLAVNETETLKIDVKAVDPDGDLVRYYFTSPAGKRNGEWKTTYENEGEHTIWATATDGYNGQTIPIQVTIMKNNRAPTLKIKDDEITVNEMHLFSFPVSAFDPDGDELNIRLDNLPPGASFSDGRFEWQPDNNIVKEKSEREKSEGWWANLISRSGYLNKKLSKEEESIWLNFAASDRETEVVHPVRITVKNVNRPPKILDYLPSESKTVEVNEPVIFHVAAADDDGDKLAYKWSFGINQEKVVGTDTVERTYLASGNKKVKVEVSDGRDTTIKEWNINVIENEVPEFPEIPRDDPSFKVYVIRS